MKIGILKTGEASFGELIRIQGIAAHLRNEGHEVDILEMNRSAALRSLSLAFAPFCVKKFWISCRRFGVPASKPFWKIVIDGILNAFYLLPRLRAGAYQILLAETHQAALCAWLVRPHIDTRLYVDFHGTADEVVVQRAFYRQGFALEGLLVRECELAIVCSGIMRNHLIAKHRGDPARFIVCHNGAEPHAKVADHASPLRAIYGGVFAYYQRVMDFVEAARLNTDPEIEFYLMGGGGDEKQILDYIDRHSVRIKWLGYRPRAEALDLFATMQVGVLPTTDDIARQVASPIKILDYAACGLPVVTVAVGEWSSVFRDYGAGVVCAKCNGEALLEAIRSLKDKERWTIAAQNSRRLIQEARAWPVVLAPLFAHLRAADTKMARG